MIRLSIRRKFTENQINSLEKYNKFIILPNNFFYTFYYLKRYPNPDEQIDGLMKLPALKGKRYNDYKHIFIPCNARGHWILLNVQLDSEIVEIYDSFNTAVMLK